MSALATAATALARGWLWIVLALYSILAHAGGLGFQPAAAFLGVGGFLICLFQPSSARYLMSPWALGYLVFVLWAWLSATWTVHDPSAAATNAGLLFAFAVPLIFAPAVIRGLSSDQRILPAHLFMAMGVFGVGIMALDIASGYGLATLIDPVDAGSNLNLRQADAEMNLGRGLITMAQFAWPIVFLMVMLIKRGWGLGGLFLAALVVTAIYTRISLILPALIVSGAFAAIAWRAPKIGLILAFTVAAASILFAPLIGFVAGLLPESALMSLPGSWDHRLRMWHFASQRIAEAPLLGNGFDASRSYQDTYRFRDGRDIVIVSLHPHNVGMQVWLETGVIGALLLVGTILASLRAVLAGFRTPARAAALAGAVMVIAINGATTVGAWQYWWWGAILLTICFAAFVPTPHCENRFAITPTDA